MITVRRALAAIVLLFLVSGGLWWALRPAPEAVAIAAVADPPAEPERKRPKVKVRKLSAAPQAEAVAAEAAEAAEPEAQELAHVDLTPVEKYGVSSASSGLGHAVSRGCLAHSVARTGRTEPLIIEFEVSMSADGLHELVVLYDEEADAEAIACLEEVAWGLHWPRLAQPGVYTTRTTMVMEAEVKPIPMATALEQANQTLDIVMSPAVMDVALRAEDAP